VSEHAIGPENALMTLQKHHVAELAFGVDPDVLSVTLIKYFRANQITKSMCL